MRTAAAWAVAALIAFVIAFVIALILHAAGGKPGSYWVDAELLGFIFVSLALLFVSPLPWRRPDGT